MQNKPGSFRQLRVFPTCQRGVSLRGHGAFGAGEVPRCLRGGGAPSGSDPITFGGALFWRGASRFPSDDAVWWKRTALTDQCLAARTLSLTAYRFLAAAPGATTGISRRVSPDKPRTAQTGLSAIQGASLHVAGL